MGLRLFDSERVLFETNVGWRDREEERPVDADTIFGVASVTKAFTALSLLIQQAAGRLHLGDPVTDYLPFKLWDGAEPPTLRQFLNQTTGLPPTPTMTWLRAASQDGDPVTAERTWREAESTVAGGRDEVVRRASTVGTLRGMVDYLNAETRLLSSPGELFSYSNDGFCLMGGLVEEVSGQPFDEFVTERILLPLGMTRSTFDLDAVLADDNHATLYDRDDDGKVLRSPAWQTTGRMLGGGMLKSTMQDLTAWVRFLMAPERFATGGPVSSTGPGVGALDVPPELVRDMAAGDTWAGPALRYGLGLQRRDGHHGLTLIGHGGGLKGVSSQVGWVPELGVGAVVLSNLGGLNSLQLWTSAINAYAGLPLGTAVYEPEPFAASSDQVAEVLGSYASGEPYGRLRLFLDDAGAMRAAVGVPPVEVPAFMTAPSEVALRYEDGLDPVTFLRRDGRVWAAHMGLRALERVG